MKKKSSEILSVRTDKLSENDFVPESSKPKTFDPTFGLLNEDNPGTDAIGYSGGIISPVSDDGVTTTLGKESSISFFKKLIATGQWTSIATFDLDISSDGVQKYSSDNSRGLKKDLRFSTLDKKYDLFYFDFSKIKKSDVQYCLENSLASSRPLSLGFISGISNDNISQLEKLGFSRSLSFNSDDLFLIKKNDIDSLSNVEISDNNGNKKAYFLCDIASKIEDKIAGLQPYRSIKYGSGLVFKYAKPQDVTYHMGAVSFPIDIIFVGSNNKIKKIVKNVLPGTLGVFGSSDTSSVIEISGNAAGCLGIGIGDTVSLNEPIDHDLNKFDMIFSNLSSANNQYIKTASFTRRLSFGNFDIFNTTDKNEKISDFIKTAAEVATKNDISIYNFDSLLLSEFGKIKLANDYRKYSISEITEDIRYTDWGNITKSGCLANFMSANSFTPPDVRRSFLMMKDDFLKNKKVIIATSISKNLDLLKLLIVKRACEEVVFDHNIHSIDIVSIPDDVIIANNQDILKRFNANSLSYSSVSIKKESGAQIPDETKEMAALVVEYMSQAEESLGLILAAFKNNSNQYNKNRDDKKLIAGSADTYSFSSKRLSKKITNMLLLIKKSIKIMNEIKDISSVDEKIEALALSCKEFVSLAEDIFDLESKISEDTFVDELIELSDKLEKSTEDVANNINNFSDYILKNILNKKVLSR